MPAVRHLDGVRGPLGHARGVRVGAVPRDHRHLGMRPEPGGDGLREAILQAIDGAALLESDDNRAIATALAVGPVVEANHAWRWSLRGLVVAHTAQHGLTAPRPPLPRELAGTRRPTQHEPRVTLGLAGPGGGVGIRAGHRRHPLGEGLPRTRGGVATKAPHLEREEDRARRPGQIGQGPAIIAMNAGG
jgi:hypothetical protein